MAVYRDYKSKMDLLVPGNEAENEDKRIQLIKLFNMGFESFQLNKIVIQKFNGDMNKICDELTNH